MTNLDSVLKSKDITLTTKGHIVKAMVFTVVLYECESWTTKKAECWRIDAFELWCWRRLSRVSWTARISSQSILKESSPEYSWEGLMLKLKLQYCDHLMQRANLLEKTLMLGKTEGKRRGWQRMRWLDGIPNSHGWTPGDGEGHEGLACCSPWGHAWATELNWTDICTPWILIGRPDAKAPIIWPPDVKAWLTGKDSDAGKDWRQKEKGGGRGWEGWMTSLTQWTWVWVNSRRWRTGKPGMLQSLGSQRVRHDLVTEQQLPIDCGEGNIQIMLKNCY